MRLGSYENNTTSHKFHSTGGFDVSLREFNKFVRLKVQSVNINFSGLIHMAIF